eukprot:scaffold392659_cov42-Prasinocladus_malaysianus.AAC.1
MSASDLPGGFCVYQVRYVRNIIQCTAESSCNPRIVCCLPAQLQRRPMEQAWCRAVQPSVQRLDEPPVPAPRDTQDRAVPAGAAWQAVRQRGKAAHCFGSGPPGLLLRGVGSVWQA